MTCLKRYCVRLASHVQKPRALDKETLEREAVKVPIKSLASTAGQPGCCSFSETGERRQQNLRYPLWKTSLPPFHLLLLPFVLLDQLLQHFLQAFRIRLYCGSDILDCPLH